MNSYRYSELVREKMWTRVHLTPLLQAEEDRDQVRRHFADKEREKKLLGSETKVYHSDRYVDTHTEVISICPALVLLTFVIFLRSFVRPTYAYTPSKVTQ